MARMRSSGNAETEGERLSDWWGPLSLLAIAILMTVGLILSAGAGEPGKRMAVVFPPWWSEERGFDAVIRSGAFVASIGPVGWIIIVEPKETGDAERLYRSGAIALFGARFVRLCGA